MDQLVDGEDDEIEEAVEMMAVEGILPGVAAGGLLVRDAALLTARREGKDYLKQEIVEN